MTVRIPQRGEPLLLDGLRYLLTNARLVTGDEGQVAIQAFERPTPADDAEAAAWKGNFHYKKSGLCNRDELVWLSPAEWASALREQAFALARGKPAARAWAMASVDALLAAAPIGEGAWTLPDRHLLSAPVTGPEFDTFLPDSLEEATLHAEAILRHHLPAEG